MKDIIMYSTDWCGDCVRSKAFLDSIRIPFVEVNVDHDDEANGLHPELTRWCKKNPNYSFPRRFFFG